ncbi:glycosyltransferase family 2 protein [Pararhodobacter sp.]|uniref:glycosyltransferase family 2 protein n=1 Tax=Pararhodobacter sp. TaxID=2127056 RepID=UPI002FDCE883
MKVSIVIPTYNAEKFIEDTLTSIARQTHSDHQVIISDGGSTDRTLEIVRSFSFADIKIVSKPDRGVPHALNRGFALADGEIVCWLNSDDVYVSRHCLSEAVTTIRNGADVVFGHCAVLDAEGTIKRKVYSFISSLGPERRNSNLFTGALFFRKEVWESFGGFSEKYQLSFESEIYIHALRNHKVEVNNGVLAGFRKHGGGLSDVYREKLARERDMIYSDFREISPLSRKLHRIIAHIKQRNLHFVISNAVRSRVAGASWREID